MMKNGRFGVKQVMNCTLYNIKTGEPELFLDTLKMSNLENASEESTATGGQSGGRLLSWDFNRTANFTVQDALLNPKAISMQVGNALEKKIETIYAREVLIFDGTGKITLSHTPNAGSVKLYLSESGYGHDSKVVAPTVTGSDVTATVAEASKQVIAYYTRQTTTEAEIITISSDKFGGFYKIIGDTFWRNEATGDDEMVQLVIEKAKLSSTFTLTMQPDGDPSVKLCA